MLAISVCILGFSQGDQFLNGWIKSDLAVKQGDADKVKQDTYAVSSSGDKTNVWLESANGWVKLRFSIHQQSKKQSAIVSEESIPIYDQGKVLWEREKLHRL